MRDGVIIRALCPLCRTFLNSTRAVRMFREEIVYRRCVERILTLENFLFEDCVRDSVRIVADLPKEPQWAFYIELEKQRGDC